MGKRILAALVGLLAMIAGVQPVRAGAGDWNDKQIRWQSWEEGKKTAAAEKKPICLIFFTSWCPHCAHYSAVFQDPAVVRKTESFVMVRADADKERALGEQFKPDGSYIPRTFFLSSEGVLDETLTAGRPKHKYFYDTQGAAGILAGMEAALQRFGGKGK